MQSVQNEKEKNNVQNEKEKTNQQKWNFAYLYLRIGRSDLLQIWSVDSPTWQASQMQKIWSEKEISELHRCENADKFIFKNS